MSEVPNIVELIDEDDNTVSFEHIMTLDYDGQEYVILVPSDEGNETDESEIVILKIAQDEDGDDIYVSIDDEEELEEVYDAFLQVTESQEE